MQRNIKQEIAEEKTDQTSYDMNMQIYTHLTKVKRICAPFDPKKIPPPWLPTLNLLLKFQTAMDYVLATLAIGASNRIEDIERTAGWVLNQEPRYNTTGQYYKTSDIKITPNDQYANRKYDLNKQRLVLNQGKWYFHSDGIGSQPSPEISALYWNQKPLSDPKFNLPRSKLAFLAIALLAIARRQGNCGDRCKLLIKYLWEHSEGIKRLEYASTKTFDHALVIVNRTGQLNNAKTWGNAWVLDTWFHEGIIFPAAAFATVIQNIKAYAKEQKTALKDIVDVKSVEEGVEELAPTAFFEVFPEKDIYPTYMTKPLRPLESYYIVSTEYPKTLHGDNNILPVIESLHAHKKNFEPTLNAIQKKDFKLKSFATEETIVQLIKKRKVISSKKTFDKDIITHSHTLFKKSLPRQSLPKEKVKEIGLLYLRGKI